jgi:hypothetical protein
MKSVNFVSELCRELQQVHTNIVYVAAVSKNLMLWWSCGVARAFRNGPEWVLLIHQYFATLTEICQGREENLQVRTTVLAIAAC